MLSDPVSVTYNSLSKSLARSTGFTPVGVKQLDKSHYATSDGEIVMSITKSLTQGGHKRVEILLGRVTITGDVDPFDRTPPANYVGLVFITDKFGAEASDVDLLDAALRSLVDDTLRDRLIAGEL